MNTQALLRSAPKWSRTTKPCALLALAVSALALSCVDSAGDGEPETSEVDREPEPVYVEVEGTAVLRAIDPLIYGVNPHTGYRCDDEEALFTACRLGGNRWTAYNWENNLSNAGRDYRYQNDQFLGRLTDPLGFPATRLVARAESVGAAAMLTVPIVDYVAGISEEEYREGDYAVGDASRDPYDVRRYENHLTELFKQNLPRKDGELSLTPDLEDDFVYQDEFVNLVRDRAGDVRVIFSLDNEPGLWSNTHPEVHPARVGYDELV